MVRSKTEYSLKASAAAGRGRGRSRPPGKLKRNTTVGRNVGQRIKRSQVSPERKRSSGGEEKAKRSGEFGWLGRACDVSRRGLVLQQFDQEAAAIGQGGCGHVRLVRLNEVKCISPKMRRKKEQHAMAILSDS